MVLKKHAGLAKLKRIEKQKILTFRLFLFLFVKIKLDKLKNLD